ncbi:MAG: GNAT family N-acetyltransferase [Defluviitaleaceae bacterium]|nr:GNAT family N-acetyltransferase [Defluviitaleaceae bacterium]
MKVYETLENGIKIVEYDPSLAESIAKFWNMCSQGEDDWGGDSGISTASKVISDEAASSHFNLYLAVDGEDVVGYCKFSRYMYDPNTLYVALLGTRPDYRSKKLGKALLLRCVQRTIELGYPRLDLFTWSGNTAAVPLYKKSGFLWEDRSESTHLVNFMPTILTLPIFEDFFKKVDWYGDSTRSLEIVPDGIKTNGFELFGYSWEKDGESLKVGYERTGRQMRMIETDDYKIELIAQDHELAFGTDYECTFIVENKTGKELNIKINGKENENIRLDCNFNSQVTGKQVIYSKFYVGAINEPLDAWKVHPCIMADVEINGHEVTFGLGINAKFPLLVNFNRECLIDQVGMDVKTYIDIESALPEDATITINMPKNEILDIKASRNSFVADVSAKGKVSIPVVSTTLAIGAEKLELNCTAIFKSGKEINFTVPAFILTRDMVTSFAAEDFENHSVINGSWKLAFVKNGNEFNISHLTNKDYFNDDAFDPPTLGKPFDDEFSTIKPNITTHTKGNAIIMEVEFISEKFKGMVVTQIYTLFATGLITRSNRVENRGDKPRHSVLQDSYGLLLSDNAIFSYNSQITQGGLNNANSCEIDENWVFEDSKTAPTGYYWPHEYTANIQWGCVLSLEIDLGELKPLEAVKTKPVVYALGLFSNYNDFRNYARQTYELNPAPTVKPMEIVLNEYNPFVQDSKIGLDIINNRDEIQAGTITVSSKILKEALSQTNPQEELVEKNSFDLNLNKNEDIATVNVAMNMLGYEKTAKKALFFPKGEVKTLQEGTSYVVNNGIITFKADPNYSNGCYSLTDAKGQEWFLNQYPEHKPFSWFNPYIGGLRTRIVKNDEAIGERDILKEKTTAEFVELRDNLGNIWKGMCTTTNITENEDFKGIVCKSYYLTQPGLPILCSFYKYENHTGEYRNDRVWLSSHLKPDEDAKNAIIEATSKDGSEYCRRLGSLECDEMFYENTSVISSSRAEKLYSFASTKNTHYLNDFWANHKIPVVCAYSHTYMKLAHGEAFTSVPAFFVITDKNLPKRALNDLERVTFS